MDPSFPEQEVLDRVPAALRRIVFCIDQHLKKLARTRHLTMPQVVLLREIRQRGPIAPGDLSMSTNLSKATGTGILDRLKIQKLAQRARGRTDRRRVFVSLTPEGETMPAAVPPLLQENFVQKFHGLKRPEPRRILSSLERAAALMHAGEMKASPALAQNIPADAADDINGGNGVLKETSAAGRETGSMGDADGPDVRIHRVSRPEEFPQGMDMKTIAGHLHESLQPYEDTPGDIERGIRDAFTVPGREGGFSLIAESGGRTAGALVMQKTGMKGYAPENILLFVAVSPGERGTGVGHPPIEHALGLADGSVTAHVEYDNPARRLYRRIGFAGGCAEMRYAQ